MQLRFAARLPQHFTIQMRFAAQFYHANEGCRKFFIMQMKFAVRLPQLITPSRMVKVCGKLICMVKVCWKEFAANLPQCSPESLFLVRAVRVHGVTDYTTCKRYKVYKHIHVPVSLKALVVPHGCGIEEGRTQNQVVIKLSEI